jgi:DNA-binding transcriptional LysR family regulator
MKLTHRHIEIFRNIMEAPNLKVAAAIMGTSQPTLSRELSELEDLLDYKLFIRVGRRLQPTASAITLFREVERSYISLNNILTTAIDIGKYEKGQMSVLCVPGIAHAFLPAVCRRFRERHHSVGLSIVAQEPPLLEEWLTTQRHDLGLIESAAVPSGTHQEAIFFFEEVCILPLGHRLLEKDVLYPSDFEGEEYISQSPVDPIRLQLDEVFRQHDVRRVLSLDACDSFTICKMVMEGLGVSIINPMTALSIPQNSLEMRRFSIPVPYCINVIRPEYRPYSHLFDQFIEDIKVEIANLRQKIPV